jgi:hypothetical protein
VPEGLRCFARSPSPDRAKEKTDSVLSVSLWLVKTDVEIWYVHYAELKESTFLLCHLVTIPSSEFRRVSNYEDPREDGRAIPLAGKGNF